jgi:hypothetical protein
MKVGKELGRWLENRPAQQQNREEIEAYGRRFRGSGPMAELAQKLSAISADDSDGIMAIAEEYLARTDIFDAAISEMIGAAARDPFFRPPLRRVVSEVHLGLLLLDSEKLSILLAITTPDALARKRMSRNGKASITFGGQRNIFKFLKAGGSTLSFWEAPRIDTAFSVDAGGRCRKVCERAIVDNETIFLDGRSQSFVIEHATSDIVYIQVVTPSGAAPVSVEYDADTLSFAGASSTDEIGSRVQMMVSLLRLLDRADAAPLIRECLASPHFYVRWHVMREFLVLDADLALPSLREMADSDPHPEVRAAAVQTLAAFFPDEDAANREDDLCRV